MWLIVADSRRKYQVFIKFCCKTFFKIFSHHWKCTMSKGYDCWDPQAYEQWRRNWQTVTMSCYHRIHRWLLSWKESKLLKSINQSINQSIFYLPLNYWRITSSLAGDLYKLSWAFLGRSPLIHVLQNIRIENGGLKKLLCHKVVVFDDNDDIRKRKKK